MNKIKLSELVHIDAPLIIAELTNVGESLVDIPWSKNKFNFKPYCVFVRKNNSLYYYYDNNGANWKIDEAGKFDENILIDEFNRHYPRINQMIEKEKALDEQTFRELIEYARKYWTWFDCMWWLIEYKDKNGLDTSNVLKLRKTSEHFTPNIIATIRNTIKSLIPEYAEYTDVLTIEEVLDRQIPDVNVLKERMRCFAYTDGRLFNSFEDVAGKYNVYIEEEGNGNTRELKGQIAYPGKAVGHVRIVNSREDMNDFKEGDIIVSSTTTPDFIPVMKIAGAIISEHGGVICHASITSRELKKTCLVGVKGATKVLKDGDMVEVDAEKGVVRILK